MPQNLETLANTSEAGLTQQGGAGGSFNLENLARSFLQSQANKPRDNFIVGRGRGGTPIFDFSKPSEGENIMKGLEGLAMSFLQQKQQQKRQDFVEKVKEIMSSSATTEDKMNGLMQLRAVDPELYKQIGIDDINKTYLETMKLRGGKPKTATEQYREDLQRAKRGEITWEEVKTKYPESSKQVDIEKVRKATLPKLQRAPGFRMGTGSPISHIKSKLSPAQAEINEKTMGVIDQIRDDPELIQELLDRREEAEAKGIDIAAILEYYGLDEKGKPRK